MQSLMNPNAYMLERYLYFTVNPFKVESSESYLINRSILTDSKMSRRSVGVSVITAAGGRSYKENSRFKRKVATDLYKLYSSYISCWIESEYMSAYSFVLVTLDNTYWSLGSCWFHHVPADCWSWFLLVGFVVPTGLLMVSAALPGRYCLCIVS
ncbi:hypothetical protein Tco_0855975 [Tanacetum coccineum]